MSILLVQQDINAIAASPAVPSTWSAPTVGNLLIAIISGITGNNVTYDAVSGWTANRQTARSVLFSKISDGSETSPSFSYPEAVATRIYMLEASATNGWTGAFDTSGAADSFTSATSVTLATDASMVGAGNELAVGMATQYGTNGGSEALTNGWTAGASGGTNRDVSGYRVYATGGSTATSDFSWLTARAGNWIVGAFKEAVAAIEGTSRLRNVSPLRW